jgi:hypothetical protein
VRFLAVVVLASGCISIPTAQSAGVSFSTEPSDWPANVTCLNDPTAMNVVAKEVLYATKLTVVIAGGDKAISDEKWATYTPSAPNTKNSDRHTLFTHSCFIRSPGKTADCVGDGCRDVLTLDGYSWIGLSKVRAADCVGTCAGTTAKPGGLVFVVTEKCHEMTFEGEQHFLNGPSGERAIMHATPDGTPRTDVELPAGWTITTETLSAPLVLRPFGGGDACFYNIIRDSQLQSYHQLKFAGPSYP